MADVPELFQRKIAELRQRPFAELERIVDTPECSQASTNGRSYACEIHARRKGGDLELMIEYSRRVLLVSFGSAVYVTKRPDGTLLENTEPW